MSSLRRIFGGIHLSAQSSPRNNAYPRSDDFDHDDDIGGIDERRMAFTFLQPSPSQSSINIDSIENNRQRSKALAQVASDNGSKSRLKAAGPSFNNANSKTFDFDVEFIDENPSMNASSYEYSMKSQSRKSIPPENADSLNPFHPYNMKQRLDSQQFYSPRSEVNSHVSKPTPTTTHRPNLPRQSGMNTVPSNSSMRASNMAASLPNSPTVSSAMSRRMMRRSDSSDMSDNDGFISPTNVSTAQSRPPPRPQTLSSPTFASKNVVTTQSQRYPPKPSMTPSSASPKYESSNKDTAFFFDAFGLDEKEIDLQVSSALEDIAGSNLDFEFAFDFNDGESVSSGFTNTSQSQSLNSARASPTINPPKSSKISPTFWDDEAETSSHSMPSLKNNQKFSNDDFSPSTKRNANLPSHRKPQGHISDSYVNSFSKSSDSFSAKDNTKERLQRDRFDTRTLPDAFTNNSLPSDGYSLSKLHHTKESVQIKDKTASYGRNLMSLSFHDLMSSQPGKKDIEHSSSPGRRRAQEWGREQQSEISPWPPYNVENDTSKSKSAERARIWATETPSVIHQRRAVVGDKADSDIVFSDVNSAVEKMIKDGGQGFRPRLKANKVPITKSGTEDSGDNINNNSEDLRNKTTNEVTKYPMVELKGLSQASALSKINRRSLEISNPSNDSETATNAKMYSEPSDRAVELERVDISKPLVLGGKEMGDMITIKGSEEKDVASLIRQRIAANKKTVAVPAGASPQSNAPTIDARPSLRIDSESRYDEAPPRNISPVSFKLPNTNALDRGTTRSVSESPQSTSNTVTSIQSTDTRSPQLSLTNDEIECSKLSHPVVRKEMIHVKKVGADIENDLPKYELGHDQRNGISSGNPTRLVIYNDNNSDDNQNIKNASISLSLKHLSTSELNSDDDSCDSLRPTPPSVPLQRNTIRKSPTEEVQSVKPTADSNRASETKVDDKHQIIAAMLSKRSVTTDKSEPSSKKNETCVSDEKKGIISSLLSRRKVHEESTKDIGAKHSSESKTQDERTTDNNLPPLKNDPLYHKYFMMLKIGMPMEVVKHALLRDGLDPSVMDGDIDKPAVIKDEDDGIALKDDPRYAKYFKMLKMGLPLGAVKNCMARDGEDPDLLDGDHNAPAMASRAKAGESSRPKEKDKFRRARVHWDSKGKVSSTSVWAIVKQDIDVDSIEIDDKEFESLFQAEVGSIRKAEQGARGKESSSKKNNAVKVIDPKRANNGGIVLARLKMSYDELATAVDSIDDSKLSSEQVQGIVGYIPSKDERNALRSYITSYGKNSAEAFENLCECEKFMVAMMTVKHSKEKMRALQFKLQFNQCLQYLVHDINTIERACEELRNSVRFRKLLGIVLSLGNKLNTAGRRQKGKVGSFTIQSLLKLHQTKAFDNKTTFLQYVVLVVERNDGNLSGFKEDIPSVMKAEKIFWDQCMSDLDEVENQLQNVRKMALFETREKKKAPWAKSKNEEDDNLSDSSMTLEEEVAALRSTKIGVFALDAIKKVSSLMGKVESTKATFVKLLEYFGEEENKGLQPHSLFEIIVTFSKHYDTARKELITQGKLKVESHRPTKKIPDQNSAVQPKVNQLPVPSKSNVDQSVRTRSLESYNGSHNLKVLSSASSRTSLMSDFMGNVKMKETEQFKDTQSETKTIQPNILDVKVGLEINKKLQSLVDVDRDAMSQPELIKSKLSPSPTPPSEQVNESKAVDGSKAMIPQAMPDIHNIAFQTLTPSPTASKPQSPTIPAAFFISENRSFEGVAISPHAFDATFSATDAEERDEIPFDQKQAVAHNVTVHKTTLTRSERDSVSNAQTTLRARRERLARRKLINR